MAEACQRCGLALPEGANFCPACGTKLEASRGLSRAQILCLAAVAVEVAALAATALFVVPLMRSTLAQQPGHRSWFTQLVFSPYWVPPFIPPVLLLGALAASRRRSVTLRVVLLSACLAIGLIPIFGSAMGIYVATFEVALGDGSGP